MIEVICKTETEIKACLFTQNIAVLMTGVFALSFSGTETPYFILKGDAKLSIEARDSSQPRIVARGSSQPHIEARESSQPHIVARDSSQPRIEAWGSSQPHIEARESSQPHIEASMACQLNIKGAVTGKVHAKTAVTIHGKKSKIIGGKKLFLDLSTPKAWCEYYGIQIKGQKALLFKGLRSDFKSARNGDYTPGTIPICEDWDGGKLECGKGYHLSPHPQMTKEFCTPEKFVAGWVSFKDMAVHPDGDCPQKCKIHKYAEPVWECDEHGERVA